MKIVLDTNCLLIAVPNTSAYHSILTALQQGNYTLCCSNEMLMEYEEKLTHFYKKQTANDTLNFIFYSLNTLLVEPYFQWNLITADPDDNKFVDCAISANANFIVTNDKHFNILKMIDFPKVNVINIDQFIKFINQPPRP